MTVMSLRWLRLGVTVVLAACLAACASGGVAGTGTGLHDPLRNYDPGRTSDSGRTGEFATIYGAMGLAASGPPLFFVGDVAYFATN